MKSAFCDFWPDIDSRAVASQARWQGVFAAALSCVVTVVLSALGSSGYSAWCLVDAGLFALVAWMIWTGSFAWSVIGLMAFVGERVYNVWSGARAPMYAWIVAAGLVVCYVNAIRATWWLRRHKEDAA